MYTNVLALSSSYNVVIVIKRLFYKSVQLISKLGYLINLPSMSTSDFTWIGINSKTHVEVATKLHIAKRQKKNK